MPNKDGGKSLYYNLINSVGRTWSYVEKGVLFLVICLMIALVIITLTQVFYRYVLNNPLTWSEELARYIFVWIVYLSTWYAFKNGGHLGMDFFTSKLPHNLQKMTGRLIDLIILVFLIIVLRNASDILIMTSRQTSAALKLPMALIYLAFPLSAFLMVVEIILSWLHPDRKSPGVLNVERREIEK